MITYELCVNRLTDEERKHLDNFQKIAKEAEDAENLIMNTWLFRSREEKILIGEDEELKMEQYFYHDGKWTLKFSGEKFCTVKCEAKAIFDYFVAEYIHANGMTNEYVAEEIEDKVRVCKWLREFIEHSKEMHEK